MFAQARARLLLTSDAARFGSFAVQKRGETDRATRFGDLRRLIAPRDFRGLAQNPMSDSCRANVGGGQVPRSRLRRRAAARSRCRVPAHHQARGPTGVAASAEQGGAAPFDGLRHGGVIATSGMAVASASGAGLALVTGQIAFVANQLAAPDPAIGREVGRPLSASADSDQCDAPAVAHDGVRARASCSIGVVRWGSGCGGVRKVSGTLRSRARLSTRGSVGAGWSANDSPVPPAEGIERLICALGATIATPNPSQQLAWPASATAPPRPCGTFSRVPPPDA